MANSTAHGSKLDSIQIGRGVAALLVLGYHLATTLRPEQGTSVGGGWLHAYFGAIGFAGVDLFFVISGAVMTLTTFAHLGEWRQVGPFLARRAARIYPLYWLVAAAVIAIRLLAPGVVARDVLTGEQVIKSLLLWPQRDFPLVAVGWTLTFEMYFYLVFAALMAAPRRLFLPAMGAWAVAVLAAQAFVDSPTTPSLKANLETPLWASTLALEFVAGAGVGWLLARGMSGGAWITLAIGACWFFGIGGYIARTRPDLAVFGLTRVATFGVGAALLVYGVAALELRGRSFAFKPLVFLGDASYSLYLTHVYVILGCRALGARGSLRFLDTPATKSLACGALCLAVAAACYLAVERPLIAFFRRRRAATG